MGCRGPFLAFIFVQLLDRYHGDPDAMLTNLSRVQDLLIGTTSFLDGQAFRMTYYDCRKWLTTS